MTQSTSSHPMTPAGLTRSQAGRLSSTIGRANAFYTSFKIVPAGRKQPSPRSSPRGRQRARTHVSATRSEPRSTRHGGGFDNAPNSDSNAAILQSRQSGGTCDGCVEFGRVLGKIRFKIHFVRTVYHVCDHTLDLHECIPAMLAPTVTEAELLLSAGTT